MTQIFWSGKAANDTACPCIQGYDPCKIDLLQNPSSAAALTASLLPTTSSLPIQVCYPTNQSLRIRAFRVGRRLSILIGATLWSLLQISMTKAVDPCRDHENVIAPMRHAAHLESCLNRQRTHFRAAPRKRQNRDRSLSLSLSLVAPPFSPARSELQHASNAMFVAVSYMQLQLQLHIQLKTLLQATNHNRIPQPHIQPWPTSPKPPKSTPPPSPPSSAATHSKNTCSTAPTHKT